MGGVVKPLGNENRGFNTDMFFGVVKNVSIASAD